ncbi:hypothetical protein [Allorhizocola rhizosphaerae]|uniref:hypothetical protein n=1 Tax=Allorhizocola rhizosphaerae TaxID=1872709 RepID=UPI0013C2A15A|nr:hypothetical protein [Allorhizocola rhizosphaerae]
MSNFRAGRHGARLLLAGLMALAPMTALASPAAASPEQAAASDNTIMNGWGYVTEGNLRKDPNLNGERIVTIYNQWVDIVCWIDGGNNGFGSNRWFKTNYYSHVGYLSSGVVSSQPAVGHC